MTASFTGSDDLRGAKFTDVDLSGAVFREADLSGVTMHGVLLIGADIDGAIGGLKINGVEVLPLIEAELDRREPDRVMLRATTAEGLREAWAMIRARWAATVARAEALPPGSLDRSVNDEWSFAQTLRHLVFVTDSWLGNAVLAQTRPFHRLGLPATFMNDVDGFGIDPVVNADWQEVLAARAERLDQVQSFVDGATQEELERTRELNPEAGWPPPAPRTALSCLRVILNEEWAHHEFAVRDLAIIEAEGER